MDDEERSLIILNTIARLLDKSNFSFNLGKYGPLASGNLFLL